METISLRAKQALFDVDAYVHGPGGDPCVELFFAWAINAGTQLTLTAETARELSAALIKAAATIDPVEEEAESEPASPFEAIGWLEYDSETDELVRLGHVWRHHKCVFCGVSASLAHYGEPCSSR